MQKKQNISTQGFTLIECVIATVVFLVGIMAVYSLVVYSVKMQVISRDLAAANSLARAKIEELRNSPVTNGGSLTSDSAGYYDKPSTVYTRRWQISSDVANMHTVTVKMIPSIQDRLMPEVKIATKMK